MDSNQTQDEFRSLNHLQVPKYGPIKIFAQLGPTIFEVWVEFDIKLISLLRSARSHHTCVRHKLYFPNLNSNWSWEGLFLPKELEICRLGFKVALEIIGGARMD